MPVVKFPLRKEEADELMDEARLKYKKWKNRNLAKSLGFFPIFNTFVSDEHLKNLSGNALKLYIYLGIHSKNETGESWHSTERIADYFGCDKRSIKRWLEELESYKMIYRVQKGYMRVANTFLCPYPKENSSSNKTESTDVE